MHELAITEGIIRAAIPEAEKYGAKRILKIHLKIGELSGVLPEGGGDGVWGHAVNE